jgi:hypothetical protein
MYLCVCVCVCASAYACATHCKLVPVGSFAPLLEHYRALEIKHIQHDTLGYDPDPVGTPVCLSVCMYRYVYVCIGLSLSVFRCVRAWTSLFPYVCMCVCMCLHKD